MIWRKLLSGIRRTIAEARGANKSLSGAAYSLERSAELVEVRKIWDQAPHNAFTDLIRFEDLWYCAFREGQSHISLDGVIRVITSPDGRAWTSATLLSSPIADLPDLRDPKITVTPDGRLLLSAAATFRSPNEFITSRSRTLVWFSSDGIQWSEPVEIGNSGMFLWRVTWHKDRAYSIGYSYSQDVEKFIRLYTSRDGSQFDALVDNLFNQGFPNEATMIFGEDDTGLCLLRRDPDSAQLGSASPPYTNWNWQSLDVRLGGPNMLLLPNGRIVAAGRLYDGEVRTSLLWLDANSGTLTEFLTLPSGGDTSYPGLVWHDRMLWVSYYSSHEGKASIYLAKVRFPNI